jgi:hypothetical protein
MQHRSGTEADAFFGRKWDAGGGHRLGLWRFG